MRRRQWLMVLYVVVLLELGLIGYLLGVLLDRP